MVTNKAEKVRILRDVSTATNPSPEETSQRAARPSPFVDAPNELYIINYVDTSPISVESDLRKLAKKQKETLDAIFDSVSRKGGSAVCGLLSLILRCSLEKGAVSNLCSTVNIGSFSKGVDKSDSSNKFPYLALINKPDDELYN